MKRIICIGNPLISEDRGGFEVLERLRSMQLPDDVEVIDGGLSGLDLLRYVDGAERVVFVDSVEGQDTEDGLIVLDAESAAATCDDAQFHHAAGLPWLLKILPGVAEHAVPPIQVVGIAPRSGSQTCWKAAALCLQLMRTAAVTGDGDVANERRPA